MNRRTPKIEKLLSKSTSQKSAPIFGTVKFSGFRSLWDVLLLTILGTLLRKHCSSSSSQARIGPHKPRSFGSGSGKSTISNFWIRISSGGVGVCPSKPRETELFGGMSRDCRRDIPGVPDKFPDPIFESFLSHFWVISSHFGVGPQKSLLSHFWVTSILFVFL